MKRRKGRTKAGTEQGRARWTPEQFKEEEMRYKKVVCVCECEN